MINGLTLFHGNKVSLAKDLLSLEKKAFLDGVSEEKLISEAGQKIYSHAIRLIKEKKLSSKIVLLCGKGNNGADGYAAALLLLQNGYKALAYHTADLQQTSPLCQKFLKEFQQASGKIKFITEAEQIHFEKKSLIIDALLGSGFSKKLEGLLLEIVQKANLTKEIILAVDIPTGLEANTGDVKTDAIKAYETITFTSAKWGFYLNQGYNYIGKVIVEPIGLADTYLEQLHVKAYLLNEKEIIKKIPPVVRKRQKYERGSLLGITGSKAMMGAAYLSGLAALRTGSGIVFLFSDGKESKAPLELLTFTLDFQNENELFSKIEQVKAVYMGPGLGRTQEIENLLLKILPQIKKPLLLDADALYFLSKHLKDIPLSKLPVMPILTPHKKEMLRLLGRENLEEGLLIEECQKFVKQHHVILVLKGAPTFIFHPEYAPIIVDRGSPAMATAGTGDVLTGIIGSLLSQQLEPYIAALLGVYIHDIAGEKAAETKGSYSVIASDLIEALPLAFKSIIKPFN